MNEVIIVEAGPNGLMLACELALDGVRPMVLDPLDGPNPEPRANGMAGQVVPMLDRRGLYERLADSPGPPCPTEQFMFAGFPLDLSELADNPMHVPFPCAASWAATHGWLHGSVTVRFCYSATPRTCIPRSAGPA